MLYFLTILIVFFHTNPSRGDAATVQALRAAYEQVANESQFRCTYTLREWSVTDVEAAFSNDIPVHFLSVGSGRFCRDGQYLRHSFDDSKGPRISGASDASGQEVVPESSPEGVTKLSGGQVRVRGLGYDEVSSIALEFTYRPGWKNMANQANLELRSKMQPSPNRTAFTRGESMISPLNPNGGSFVGLPSEPFPTPRDEDYQVSEISESRVFLEVNTEEIVQPYGKLSTKYVTEWWTEPSVPVLVRVLRRTHFENTDDFVVEEGRSTEFVKCGSHMIASRVVAVLCTGKSDPYYVKEWRSLDLGQEPPRPEDFQIELKADTMVIGTEVEANGAGRRIFDIRNPTPTLAAGQVFTETITKEVVPEGQSTSRLWLVACNVIVFAVLLSWLIWRRRSNRE